MREYTERDVGELAYDYNMIYAANVNLARMAADLIDGLKNVERRTLYIMYDSEHSNEFKKLHVISGDVLGKAHGHGPTSVEGTTVNMAQPWKNTIPLIEGSGNFGTSSGDDAGASRYITARLSKFCRKCFFSEWDDSVVDMVESGVNKHVKLPLYLPARYPFVLLNGSNGIGYGGSTDVPAFNFRELIETTIVLMKDPNANIVLIPDPPTGADVVEMDFGRLCRMGRGSFRERCRYEIDDVTNKITITALPENVTAFSVRTRIAELIETGEVPEILDIEDNSRSDIKIEITIRPDVNPYRLMRNIIEKKLVPGLEVSVKIKLSIVHNRQTIDYSIRELLLDWIQWRRDQKNVVLMQKRARLIAEERMNDVKLFIMRPENLDDTIDIFRSGKNQSGIEKKLIERYRDTEIRMDTYLARILAKMQMVELCEEAREACLKRRDELRKELEEVAEILSTEHGVDKVIIGELREGVKLFGTPRRSNVVPQKISTSNNVDGYCVMQLASDGTITRSAATNIEGEPIPVDSDGFACIVDNDSSFILVNEKGAHTFIRAKDIPVDTPVPVMRFTKWPLPGSVVAMLPVDMEQTLHCILISRKGLIKRINIREIFSKKPLIALDPDDRLNRGIVINQKSNKEILIYTKMGMGQRFSPMSIRVTSPSAKGSPGFKLADGDEIIGCFAINPEKEYLLYTTGRGKMRLNNNGYLPTRSSKHDAMVQLITIGRDRLISVLACNKYDVARVFLDDGTSEDVQIHFMKEATMSMPPTKQIQSSAAVIKVKIL